MPYKLGTVRRTIYAVQWCDECTHMVRYRSIFGAVLKYLGTNLVDAKCKAKLSSIC